MVNTTDTQKLRDRDIKPTEEVLCHELGEANDSYIKFLTKLSEHEIILNWNYYTDGKAWLGKGIYKWTGSRGGQKEKTIFWL